MWWIIVVIIGVFLVCLIIGIAVSIYSKNKFNNGDYKDGGGNFIGGNNYDSTFFTPANEKAGKDGEFQTNYYLRPLLRNDEYILANLLVPLNNGYKSEIDSLLISRKGIFCIETKKWVGHIAGSDNDEYWYQRYDDSYMADKRHNNPVKQNDSHCRNVKWLLHNGFDVENIVIFVDIEDSQQIYSRYAYNIEGFRNYYRSLPDDVLTIEQVGAIFETLKRYVATEEELKQHRIESRNRY